MWNEHTNARGDGSAPTAVTMEARGGRLILSVGRGVLEQIPWYRGGAAVAVLLGWGADAGRMRVVRGDTHKLLTHVGHRRLDKMPPVLLRLDCPVHMARDATHPAEALAHRVDRGMIEVVLPSWAAPPDRVAVESYSGAPVGATLQTPPPTSYQQGLFLPQERRAAGARS